MYPECNYNIFYTVVDLLWFGLFSRSIAGHYSDVWCSYCSGAPSWHGSCVLDTHSKDVCHYYKGILVFLFVVLTESCELSRIVMLWKYRMYTNRELLSEVPCKSKHIDHNISDCSLRHTTDLTSCNTILAGLHWLLCNSCEYSSRLVHITINCLLCCRMFSHNMLSVLQ